MKIIKILFLALTIFLCGCKRTGNQTPITEITATPDSSNGVRYVQNAGSKESDGNVIIKNGITNVYRRSSIEGAGIEGVGIENSIIPYEIVEEIEPDYKSMTTSERAKRISRAITDIKGIDTASVVISGNTAIVGIGHKGHLDNMLLMKLKREVDTIAKAADSGIRNVAVTASPELVSRVTNMANSEKSEKSIIEQE